MGWPSEKPAGSNSLSVDRLVSAYRHDKEQLGMLASGHDANHAWEFLLEWRENSNPFLHVPKMLPDGRIA